MAKRAGLVAVLPACQGRVFLFSDKRKRIAKQAIFTRAALITEQVAGNFGHLKAPGNVDIMLGQRAVILQHGSQYRTGTTAPPFFRLLAHRLNAQIRMLDA